MNYVFFKIIVFHMVSDLNPILIKHLMCVELTACFTLWKLFWEIQQETRCNLFDCDIHL